MDIAAMSVIMGQTQVRQQAGIALMDKALNQAEGQSDAMLKMLEESAQPHLGSTIDTRA